MNRSTTRRRLSSSTSPVAVNGVGRTEYTPSSCTHPHFSMRMGPHPHALSLGDSAPRSGRRRFQCAWGPTPMRSPSATPRLARAAGASQCAWGPLPCALPRRLRASLGPQALLNAHGAHSHALSLGDSAPRSGRRRFSMRMGPTPMRSPSATPRLARAAGASQCAWGPTPMRSRSGTAGVVSRDRPLPPIARADGDSRVPTVILTR